MIIAFATVVEKEVRGAFSGWLAWEGVLTLVGVGDISVKLFFALGEVPVYSTIWNVIPHSSTTESACQWVQGKTPANISDLGVCVCRSRFENGQIDYQHQIRSLLVCWIPSRSSPVFFCVSQPKAYPKKVFLYCSNFDFKNTMTQIPLLLDFCPPFVLD
jgi:hypothetical protein